MFRLAVETLNAVVDDKIAALCVDMWAIIFWLCLVTLGLFAFALLAA